ncbi:MAG TPA: anthranilate synthase component I family protein [Flavobacterium sp.]|nr:anthranilate synthase component I family protein [Flavobacterium sp.]
MIRTTKKHIVENAGDFKYRLLKWSQQFREIVFLDSNQYPHLYAEYDAVLAVEAFTSIQTDSYNAFDDLHQYQSKTQDWLFGYLTYDLKNDTEKLTSANFDGLQFPELFFFQPKKLFLLKNLEVEILYLQFCDDEIDSDFEEILNMNLEIPVYFPENPILLQQRISKNDYFQKFDKIHQYILNGDIYEMNFCMEFYAENATINPLDTYIKLNRISEPPFAVFLKNNRHYLCSASPERYLKKSGIKVISQPIKGTSKRVSDKEEDETSKEELAVNAKERSENIMIVDLVRNDLSRTASKGSVAVEELCGVYSFKQVHQLISTITSEVEHTTSPVEIIKTTFPMGSMTGAPKISAMEIIEEAEETKRGLYSGAVGYFTPQGDFDFNVVIRSILYNEQNKYLSFSVGSAVTAESLPEKEYEECLLKAKAMFQVLLKE